MWHGERYELSASSLLIFIIAPPQFLNPLQYSVLWYRLEYPPVHIYTVSEHDTNKNNTTAITIYFILRECIFYNMEQYIVYSPRTQ